MSTNDIEIRENIPEDPQANCEERELGTASIPKLFVKYSFYTFVGMFAQCLMVIFEGIIIGNGMGSEGLANVGLIMPLEYLMLALGGFFAIGISTMSAFRLGDGDTEGARKVYAQGTLFSMIFIILLALILAIFAPTVANILGAPAQFKDSITTFVRIFAIGYPFCIIGHIAVYMARVDEKPPLATWAMTGSSIIALIWLYISTYKLKLGITGTAGYYASSIGLWSLAILYFIFSKKTIFKIHMSDFYFDKSIIWGIMKIGFPFLLVQMSSTIYVTVTNNFLGRYGGPLDIAAFAVINSYILYILMMIVQSTTGGMQPIASYNYGAKLYGRLAKLIKTSILGNLIVSEILVLVFMFGSEFICGIFAGNEPELVSIAAKYSRIVIMLSALGMTSNLVQGYFQAVDSIPVSTILGIARYILFAIPLMFTLTRFMDGVLGVWYAQPIADLLAFMLTMFFVVKELKRLKRLSNK